MTVLQSIISAMNQNDPYLTEINLEEQKIGDSGVQVFAQALKKNHVVKKINLEANGIGVSGAQALAEALKTNYTVIEVNLRINRIGDSGAKAIAEMLLENRTIIGLRLSANGIGDEGVSALAKALLINRTIIWINLKMNRIGSAGAKKLAEGLTGTHTLTEIYLARNKIGDEGVQALAGAVRGNRTIAEIDLEDNGIDSLGAKALTNTLETNYTVTRMALQDCSIHEDLKGAVDSYCIRNQQLRDQCFACAVEGDLQGVKTLLQRGVAINGYGGYNNETLLHASIATQKSAIVAFLLQEGANPYRQNGAGKDAFDLARDAGDASIMQLLKRKREELERLFPMERDNKHEVRQRHRSTTLQQHSGNIVKSVTTEFPETVPSFDIDAMLAELREEQEEEEQAALKEMYSLETGIEEWKQQQARLQVFQDDLKRKMLALHEQNVDAQNAGFQVLQEQLTCVEAQQDILWQEHELKQQKKVIIEAFRQEPNLFLFYRKIQTKIEDLFISAKAAAGGFTSLNQGSIGTIAKGFALCGEMIDLMPLIGSLGNKLLQATVVKGLETFDQKRQTNLVKSISDLATLGELKKEAEAAARFLTRCYAPQLRQLPQPESNTRGAVNKGKDVLLNKKPFSGAQAFAEYGILWIFEALLERTFAWDQPLSQQFVKIITSKRPLDIILQETGGLQKMKGRYHEIKQKLSSKLGINTVLTKKGTQWALEGMYTKVGVQTPDGSLYGGNGTDPRVYGWCIGTQEMVQQRQLQFIGKRDTTEPGTSKALRKHVKEQDQKQDAIHDELERLKVTQQKVIGTREKKQEDIEQEQNRMKLQLAEEQRKRQQMEKEMMRMKEMMQQMMTQGNQKC